VQQQLQQMPVAAALREIGRDVDGRHDQLPQQGADVEHAAVARQKR